jgi:hypothetical protein
MKNLMGSP